jgi:hypothetical protein
MDVFITGDMTSEKVDLAAKTLSQFSVKTKVPSGKMFHVNSLF